MVSISWASFIPLFGKKRKALEQRAHVANEERYAMIRWREEAHRLRKYINSEMKRHFESYNGGLSAQMQMMSQYVLPTPWVPTAVQDVEAPIADSVSFNTLTYVRETRMVPITQVGRV